MCLISSTSIPTVAEEDITVYKVLGKFYHSPYLKYQKTDEYRYGEVRYDYEPGMNYARGPEAVSLVYNCCTGDSKYLIGSGFLHGYATKENAIMECAYMFSNSERPYYVYEMKIPKGTKYFKSKDGNEYCSKSLLFKNTKEIYKEEPVKTIDEF